MTLEFAAHEIRCWGFRALAARQMLRAAARMPPRVEAIGVCIHAIDRAASWEASAARWYVDNSERIAGRPSPFL